MLDTFYFIFVSTMKVVILLSTLMSIWTEGGTYNKLLNIVVNKIGERKYRQFTKELFMLDR